MSCDSNTLHNYVHNIILAILLWHLLSDGDCIFLRYLSLLYFVLIVTDDYSRVKLLGVSGKGKDTDYINASYIDVSTMSCYAYIYTYVYVYLCQCTYVKWITIY